MIQEQVKTKKPSKRDRQLNNAALISAVISNTFFQFILNNRKNSYLTYEFIAEMAIAFLGHCQINKYIIGKNPALDREGIINWCKDVLKEHPDFDYHP